MHMDNMNIKYERIRIREHCPYALSIFNTCTNTIVNIHIWKNILHARKAKQDAPTSFHNVFEINIDNIYIVYMIIDMMLCTKNDATPKIHQIEKLKFLGNSQFKFIWKVRSNLNWYQGISVFQIGVFWGCNISSRICHMCARSDRDAPDLCTPKNMTWCCKTKIALCI